MENSLNINLTKDQWEIIIDSLNFYLKPRSGMRPPETINMLALDAIQAIDSELNNIRGFQF